jgi:hypothetical protein
MKGQPPTLQILRSWIRKNSGYFLEWAPFSESDVKRDVLQVAFRGFRTSG